MNPKATPADTLSVEFAFKQAESFFSAAHVLGVQATQMLGNFPQLIFPMMVCESFSLELYLKTLVLVEGHQYTPTHDLEKLFDQLSVESKAHVRAHCQLQLAQMQQMINSVEQHRQQTTGKSDPPPKVDFEYALSMSKRAFEAFRYFHEEDAKPRDGEGWLGRPILGSVRDRILVLKPEWKNIRFTQPPPNPTPEGQSPTSPTP